MVLSMGQMDLFKNILIRPDCVQKNKPSKETSTQKNKCEHKQNEDQIDQLA